ncbi:hypothetical protein [Terrimonas sp.]|nr:hypothetical protein [Terrimonas sp.]
MNKMDPEYNIKHELVLTQLRICNVMVKREVPAEKFKSSTSFDV